VTLAVVLNPTVRFDCSACLLLSCPNVISYEHTSSDPSSTFISNYLFTATSHFICFCNHQTLLVVAERLSTLHHDNEHVGTKYHPWQLRAKRNTVSTETTKEKHNSRFGQHVSFPRRWFILWTCGLIHIAGVQRRFWESYCLHLQGKDRGSMRLRKGGTHLNNTVSLPRKPQCELWIHILPSV